MRHLLVVLFLLGHALAQDFFMGFPNRQVGNNAPVEPMINEGSPDCAQFIYAPNSLSAKCLVHKLTIESGRYDAWSISLSGLDQPEFSNTVELTVGVNQCRNTFEISCIHDDFCTVAYLNDGFKTTLKVKSLRFLINGDVITAEVTKYDNQGTHNIYQCRTSVTVFTSDKLQYEVRLYLNKAFAGHNIEINGGDVRKYRNGEQTYTTTTTEQPTDTTTFLPFVVPRTQSGSRFPFRPFPIDPTNQMPSVAPSANTEGSRSDLESVIGAGKNAKVTVNGMQKSDDGKSMLLDITIRTQVKIPNTFF